MSTFDASFQNLLNQCVIDGIAPVFFATIYAKDYDTGAITPFHLWSGRYDVTNNARKPDGTLETRTYKGGVGLSVSGISYVSDMTDNAATLVVNHIHPNIRAMLRSYDLRLANVEVHVAAMNKGALGGPGQLLMYGVVDSTPITTGAVGSDSQAAITIRSEVMVSLSKRNPAKSSDEHQKRRLATDTFSAYSGVVSNFEFSWYKKK